MRAPMRRWTEEELAQMQLMRRQGANNARIAQALQCTKERVIGKLWALDNPGKMKQTATAWRERRILGCRPQKNGIWTEPVSRALAEMAGEGLSAREIANSLQDRFGIVVSRGAVLGRCYRTGVRPTYTGRGRTVKPIDLIPQEAIVAAQQALYERVNARLRAGMQRAGLNPNRVSVRLGKARTGMGRLLIQPCNMTLASLAELLLAIGDDGLDL